LKILQTILYMITILWIIISVLLIFTIMIHNPKSQGMGGQNQLFVSTRSAEANLNKITWALIGLFFSLAIYIAIIGSIE
jgi:preprotein translocase subunit SecG